MSRTAWTWIRLLGGVAILAFLVWRVGTGPFLDGVGRLDGRSMAAATGIGLVTTVCSARRWDLVARGLGLAVPLRAAIAAYYRSQFLNTTLPGGILGDVHRGVVHGRDSGDVGAGLRAVAWERAAGQVVQAGLTLIVLLALPSPLRPETPAVAGVVIAVGLAVVLSWPVLSRHGPSWWVRAGRVAAADLRDGVLSADTWPGVVAASIVVVTGHVATFVIAARVAGSTASLAQLLPLALVVLLAMGVPTNIGGWGPREGAAAWAFGAAGLGAAQGVSTAVVYGVLVMIASLPGLVVLAGSWLHKGRQQRDRADAAEWSAPAAACREGAARG